MEMLVVPCRGGGGKGAFHALAIRAAIQVQFKAIRGHFRQFVSLEGAKMPALRQFAPRKVCLYKTKREAVAERRRQKGMRKSPPF